MSQASKPYELSATGALREIEAGRLTAVEWVTSCRDRIQAREPQVHAWASLNDHAVEDAIARAENGMSPPIPVGAKDIIDICGLPTMMGTGFRDAAPATREGGSISLMRDAGCVFMGKTVTTELGHRHPGPTRNPLNLAHTPGGSSSGSAAAVADCMVPICLGTQTSGSVIRPAAYCGVIGYKPTYNDFDKTGILANAPSMDTLGILARSIDDVGLLRGILLEESEQGIGSIDLSNISFALDNTGPWSMADDETRAHLETFMDDLKAQGAKIVDAPLGQLVPRLTELHRLISGYEFRRSIAYERLHHLDDLSAILREGRLADGHSVNNHEYQNAVLELSNLRLKLAQIFKSVDVLVSPSAVGPAPATLDHTGDAAFNAAWTLTGNPVISLPIFTSAQSGLPIGCQLIAGFGQDDSLLAISRRIMDIFTE